MVLPLSATNSKATKPSQLGVPWLTLRQFPWLAWAFRPDVEVVPLENFQSRPGAAAGWGLRTAGAYARRLAVLRGLPCYTLEDGFYRSVGLGKDGAPSFSVVLDRSGIYFDARQASDLETMLLDANAAAASQAGAELRDAIVRLRLTKYNTVPHRPVTLESKPGSHRILIVDQVAGDQSLPGAGADSTTFAAMLRDGEAAQAAGASVFVKTHPDVIAGHARGMIEQARLPFVDPFAGLDALLSEVDEVWTVSSQLGFEALMRGRPVTCYGAAFYAGWGLTTDRLDAISPAAQQGMQRRSGTELSLDTLIGIAVGRYPTYLDPVHEERVDALTSLIRLAETRDHWHSRQGRRVLGIGIALHKRSLLRAHLGAAGKTAQFVWKAPRHINHDRFDELLIWSDRLPTQQVKAARKAGLMISRVEDGFIRSQGLSARSNLPLSLNFDSKGLYFDATGPSELEDLLNTHPFSDDELARAAHLRAEIIRRGISKYNLSTSARFDLKAEAKGRPIVLVVAQVPGDASLRLGLVPYASNLAFLKAVRTARPDAYIAFKEHPDLVAGKRSGRTQKDQLQAYCDRIIDSGDTTALFAQVDEVHVMTSLAGFEALLRCKKVVCHGLPFYAGWGQTEDRVGCARRLRPLTLDELVAGSLILYPKYLMPLRLLPCRVEDVVRSFKD